jgi:ribonuclease HI
VEDTSHSIWHCGVNTQVWAREDWSHRFKGNQGTFGDLAMKILMDEPDEVSGRFATIAWSLWHERNKFRLTPYTSLPEDTHSRAIALWLEFLAENTPAETRKTPSPAIPWSPPPLGLYKANFDGAVFQDSHEAGLGVIIRDSNGLIIASLAQKIPFPGSVVMVEALAARRAVTFAIEVGTWKIELEGDSEQIIKAINQEDPIFTPYGHIIEDIRCAAEQLQWSRFNHTKREGNKAAHALARLAKVSQDTDVWLETVPPVIGDVTHRDFILIQ